MSDEHPSLSLVRQLEARHKWELDTLRAEVERLRVWAEDEQSKRHKAEEDRMNLRAEVERLRAALTEIDWKSKCDIAAEIAQSALEPIAPCDDAEFGMMP